MSEGDSQGGSGTVTGLGDYGKGASSRGGRVAMRPYIFAVVGRGQAQGPAPTRREMRAKGRERTLQRRAHAVRPYSISKRELFSGSMTLTGKS